jgi:hypothetical protein
MAIVALFALCVPCVCALCVRPLRVPCPTYRAAPRLRIAHLLPLTCKKMHQEQDQTLLPSMRSSREKQSSQGLPDAHT